MAIAVGVSLSPGPTNSVHANPAPAHHSTNRPTGDTLPQPPKALSAASTGPLDSSPTPPPPPPPIDPPARAPLADQDAASFVHHHAVVDGAAPPTAPQSSAGDHHSLTSTPDKTSQAHEADSPAPAPDFQTIQFKLDRAEDAPPAVAEDVGNSPPAEPPAVDAASPPASPDIDGPVSDLPELPPTTDPAVRVFCWSTFPNAPDYMVPMLWVNGKRSTGYILNQARTLWKDRPIADRAILLFMPEDVQGTAVEAPVNELIRNGLELTAYRQHWEEILAVLDANDLTPGRVVLDFEHGYTFWHLGDGQDRNETAKQRMYLAWDDPLSRELLPESLRDLDPREVNWFHDRARTTAWNHFARQGVTESLQRDIAAPLHAVFPDAMITNYNDANYVEVQYNRNKWAVPPVQVGRGTSPVLYAPDPEANTQLVSQCYLATGVRPVPWVAFPSFKGDREAFAQTVRGAYGAGVREFLYWNAAIADKPLDDEAYAIEVFGSLAPALTASFD